MPKFIQIHLQFFTLLCQFFNMIPDNFPLSAQPLVHLLVPGGCRRRTDLYCPSGAERQQCCHWRVQLCRPLGNTHHCQVFSKIIAESKSLGTSDFSRKKCSPLYQAHSHTLTNGMSRLEYSRGLSRLLSMQGVLVSFLEK